MSAEVDVQTSSRPLSLVASTACTVVAACRSDVDGASVPARFAVQARDYPNVAAVVGQEVVLTYHELDVLSNRIAHSILKVCAKEQSRIALLLYPGPLAIAAMLGALKAGMIYVPLDPSYPEARTIYMIQDADAALLVTDRHNRDYAERLTGGTLPLLDVDDPSNEDSTDPRLMVKADALAYILYTSGSTGQPKGVLQTHRNLLHFISSYSRGVGIVAGDRLSLLYSFSFSASLMDIYGALLNGATAYHYDLKNRGLSELPNWLRNNRITVYHSVPTVFRHLMDTLDEGVGFPSIRAVDLGGEPVYRRDVEAFRRHFSTDCLLINHLAFTEASVTAQNPIHSDTPLLTDRVSVGYPAKGMKVMILDEHGAPLEAEHVGEIALQSRYVSPGYWRQPELTASSFTQTYDGQERIYRTGDLGRILSDGQVEHLGRKDDRVKIRGFSIEVAEIEHALLRAGTIKEAAVVAREDTRGNLRLVAYLVSAGDPTPSVSSLRSSLSTSLPDYMLPSAYVFLDALPLSANGKIDRKALPAADTQELTAETYVAPTTSAEKALANIWSEVLGVQDPGVHDNFFELGGHSLLAARLFDRICKETGKNLPLTLLFQAPTIKEMAAILECDEWIPASKCLVPIRPTGTRPPFFWIHHIQGDVFYTENIVRHMSEEIPFFGLQALGLDGRDEPLKSFEEMAELYIREIRSLQPEGPYYLGGYSLGCIITLEMAHQLHAAGQKVALLAMLDPGLAYSRHSSKRSYLFQRKLIPWMMHGERHLLTLRSQGPTLFLRQHVKAIHNSAKLSVQKLMRTPLPATAQRRKQIRSINLAAQRVYRPRPYSGRITYFYAAERHHYYYAFPDNRLAWSDLAEDGLELHLVPGNHNIMTFEPHVKVLAEKLSACLRRAYALGDD